jgi:hypothetical protein
MTLRTAHGSGCDTGGAAAAIAPVELKIMEPAMTTPITLLYRERAICFLLALRDECP